VRQFPSTSLSENSQKLLTALSLPSWPWQETQISAATRRQKALNFHSSAALDPVCPLRGKAPHDGKTAVSQKKNRASLFWALVLTGAASQRAGQIGTPRDCHPEGHGTFEG
jgi:hypothetical protein